jgi:hypothetical protein
VKRTVLRAVRCSLQCCGLRFPPNAWPRWCFVRELHDGIGNPAPGRRAVVIAVGRELVGADGSLLERFLAVALEHQVGGAPDCRSQVSRRQSYRMHDLKKLNPELVDRGRNVWE